MDEQLLREIANTYLVPFFSGARLESKSIKSTSRENRVASTTPQSIAFKVSKRDKYRLVLTRDQPFAQADGKVIIPEVAVVRAFVRVLYPISSLNDELRHDLLTTFQRRIVAKAINSGDTADQEATLLSGIDQLMRWASRLYEGAPISAAIGFRNKPQSNSAPTLADIASKDFCAVVSNGHDTLLEFDFSGHLISHEALSIQRPLPSFCPYRQAPLANWTAEKGERRRVAMILNRTGEILLCRDNQLLFAFRSGRWHFLTHEPIITQMATPHNRAVRTAVYETCLDASFARTGACIGVVSSSRVAEWKRIVVSKDDHLTSGESIKAKALSRLIGKQKFQHLDRRLRQELVAIDGATVLSHSGEVLAVGAILKIPGGSSGGGRRAAAQALAALGLGIKVSQDGGITGFHLDPASPAFELM